MSKEFKTEKHPQIKGEIQNFRQQIDGPESAQRKANKNKKKFDNMSSQNDSLDMLDQDSEVEQAFKTSGTFGNNKDQIKIQMQKQEEGANESIEMFADNQIAENNQSQANKKQNQQFLEKLQNQQTIGRTKLLVSGEDNQRQSIDNVITTNFNLLTQTYEGRDKLVKFFQYLAKYLSWQVLRHQKSSPELILEAQQYMAISNQLYDARSLFRLFKSLFEIKRIQIILQCIKDTDKFTLITNVSSRAFYFMYWLFDNIQIVSRIMNNSSDGKSRNVFIHNYSVLFRRISRVFWLGGIIMFMIYCVKTLRKTYTDESDLKVAALDKMTVRELKENLRIISELRHDYWLNFYRALSDLLICLNENNLPLHILGKRLNPGVEGFFGMSSSIIYLYSLLKFKK